MRPGWLFGVLLVLGCVAPERPAARDGAVPAPATAARLVRGAAVAPAAAPASGPGATQPGPGATQPGPGATQPGPGGRDRCNNAGLRERFARCRAARDQGGCQAAGGTWGPQGAAAAPSCACPTGQGGCPCRRDGDCLAGCRAPMALNASRANRCRAMASSCAPTWPARGCWCWFGADGAPAERCTE